MFDICANGPRLKFLTVTDEYTRERLAIDVADSIRSARVIEVLAKLASVHGAPKYPRSDNGPELVPRAILKWLTTTSIDTAHIDPGKPGQNGSNESFNGKFRDEWIRMPIQYCRKTTYHSFFRSCSGTHLSRVRITPSCGGRSTVGTRLVKPNVARRQRTARRSSSAKSGDRIAIYRMSESELALCRGCLT